MEFPRPPQTLTPSEHSRRRFLQACSLAVPLVIYPGISRAGTIVAVRTWPADEYSRITLELDKSMSARHFTLAAPDRLVVDLTGVQMNAAINSLISQVQINDPYISRVRVAQHSPGVLRLVVELKQMVAPQVFTLKPFGQYQHRMVIDLYPLQAQDPLMALLSDDYDPIGDVIAKLSATDAPVPMVSGQKPPARVPAVTPKPVTPSRPSRRKPIVIALDPGHGGEDPGAVGPKGTREKDVVLAIGKRLKTLIDAQPGMKAYMTRDNDYFVPLHVRVQKARRVKADLFISIHADAWTKPTARGGSVFVLSQKGASSTMARTLAKSQNASDLIGGVKLGSHDKSLAKVLLDLSTTAQIQDSTRLASHVLNEIGRIGRLHKSHVENAGFAVLRAPDMPSILVETAFISNPEEERLLRSPEHQARLAKAIMTGINSYFHAGPALASR